MAIFQKMVDFDQAFRMAENTVVINDLPNETEEDREKLSNLILSEFNDDMINMVSTCDCGHYKHDHRLGLMCPVCHTPVKSKVSGDTDSAVWLRAPEGVQKLISPLVITQLNSKLLRPKMGIDLLSWLCDTNYRPGEKGMGIVRKLEEQGFKRGYNNFVENFFPYLEVIFRMSELGFRIRTEDPLLTHLKEHSDKIFTSYLPLPNKSLLVVEKSQMGVYHLDPMILSAIDVLRGLATIDKTSSSLRTKQNKIFRALVGLSNFYKEFFTKNSKKGGVFRSHVYSSRTNFTLRAVATSLTDIHQYDEVELPWSGTIGVFRHHLVSKLLHMGLQLNDAIGLVYRSVNRYDPLIDKLLKELIDESPDKCLYLLMIRNPSLLQGSLVRLKCRKIKTDPMDRSVGASILITPSLNLDFDGDQLTLEFPVDNWMARRWYPLEPRFNVFEATDPGKISGNLTMSKPEAASASNFLSSI